MFPTNTVEEIKPRIFVHLLFSENHAVFEVMWKNIVERGRPQMSIRRLHIVCWIPKTINTLLEYVILVASHLQQWLHERAAVLRYTCFFCSS